jgi:hypothetical protein
MKPAPRRHQHHDLYRQYHDQDSEISRLLGECGFNNLLKLGLPGGVRAVSFCCDKKGNCWQVDLLAICVGPDLIKWECEGSAENPTDCKHQPTGGDN